MSKADDMALPSGKRCSDCAWFARCVMLFQCKAGNARCDFAPSRFLQKKVQR